MTVLVMNEHFLNMRFVDSQGDVYRLVDKIKIREL